ncbi:MAG: ABC transporter ATP-binding protein [Planctomycetota bacterium]
MHAASAPSLPGGSETTAVVRTTPLVFRRDTGFTLRTPALEVARSRSLAVRGPSGCGKSTLLALLSGELMPAEGSVTALGRPHAARSERERRAFRGAEVGQVFQTFELVESLGVLQNILLPFRLHGRRGVDHERTERARALLARVGLTGFDRRAIATLSHGERQRVAIARALVTGPALILADEPTGNLDPAMKRGIAELLLSEARAANAALVVATHDESIMPLFDRVLDLGAADRAEARA